MSSTETETESETAPTEPVVTFDALPLAPDVRQAVDEMGYVHPTLVQRAVYDPAVRGSDLVVQARTGTGKTAAFGLPIINALVRKSQLSVQALVLCPTRELALQVSRELDAIGKHRDLRCVPIYGGAPMPRQVEQLAAGAHIVVGTPGRILDHLHRRTLDPQTARILVLDESDEMLSMGFLPQINEILSFLPESRQTLLFSATLPPDISRMAETRLKSPQFVTLSGDYVGALEIDHFVYMSYGDKTADFLTVLEIENPESAIIFCNTRDQTKRVAAALGERGYSADWLNADLAQGDREKVMAATRSGNLRFLVATDVAARGIDISHLTHVINFDLPESAEVYVHRTGRTGRAGRTGTAISMIAPSNVGNLYLLRLTYKIRPIEKPLPSQQELRTRAETDVVHSLAELFASRHPDADDLALARRLLTHERAQSIVAGLLRDHLGARPEIARDASATRRARPPRPANDTPPDESDPAATEAAARRTRRRLRTAEKADPIAATAPDPNPASRRSRRGRQSTSAATAEAAPAALETSAPTPDAAPEPSPPAVPSESKDATAEVFVNVGRNDGATADDFFELLEQRASIARDRTEYVRVRQRHTFVALPRELLDRAIEALHGQTIAGKVATAEEARPRG